MYNTWSVPVQCTIYGVYLYSAQCMECFSTVYNGCCVPVQCTISWVTAIVYTIE